MDSGLYLLDRVDLFNLLCMPGETNGTSLPAFESTAATTARFCSWIARLDATLTTRHKRAAGRH